MATTVSASLPASIMYIPLFREFVSDVLIRAGFTERFAYRTEIIVDELCSNAIKYGSHNSHSRIDIKLTWHEDYIDLSITDEGGSKESINMLRSSINEQNPTVSDNNKGELSLGLQIVKTLCEEIDVTTDDNSITSVHIVRKREEM